MSTTIGATIANLLATILPLIGIQIGSDDLTKTIQVIVAIVTGLWVWYQRTTLQKAPAGFGDVTAFGTKEK